MSARGVGALALCLLFGGCLSEHTTQPEDGVSFADDVAPVLAGSCAFSTCHGPNPSAKPMPLTSGDAYDRIVNVASAQVPGMDRIEPGKPDESYLIHKLQGTHRQVNGTGSQMPAGYAPLAPAVIAMIRQWVTEGALRN